MRRKAGRRGTANSLVALQDLFSPPGGGNAALVVLDHLEDPRNVGAIARSALAAGMTGMVVPERRSAPVSAVSFKAAAGALEHLPVASVSSIPDCVTRAKKAGVWTVGLDGSRSESLFGLGLLTESVAIFVGAEGLWLGPPRSRPSRCRGRHPAIGAQRQPQRIGGGVAGMFRVQRVRDAQGAR